MDLNVKRGVLVAALALVAAAPLTGRPMRFLTLSA